MKLLNLGAGSVRPGEPFTNVDSLHGLLAPGTPERDQLDREPNYIEHDIRQPLPFSDNQFDGALLSHVLEHFDAISGTALLCDCHRVLIPGGSLVVSVPDASYHRKVYNQDSKRNAMKLFGETIPEAEPKQTFLSYALFFSDHRQVFTEDSLWCSLVNAGFNHDKLFRDTLQPLKGFANEAWTAIRAHLNRHMFSLVMVATK